MFTEQVGRGRLQSVSTRARLKNSNNATKKIVVIMVRLVSSYHRADFKQSAIIVIRESVPCSLVV